MLKLLSFISKKKIRRFSDRFYELKGFCKVFLQPGETREVEIPFEDRTFTYFNVQTGKWEIEEGNYKL